MQGKTSIKTKIFSWKEWGRKWKRHSRLLWANHLSAVAFSKIPTTVIGIFLNTFQCPKQYIVKRWPPKLYYFGIWGWSFNQHDWMKNSHFETSCHVIFSSLTYAATKKEPHVTFSGHVKEKMSRHLVGPGSYISTSLIIYIFFWFVWREVKLSRNIY